MFDAKGGGGAQGMQAVCEDDGGGSVGDEVVLGALRCNDGAQRAHYIALRCSSVLQPGAGRHNARGHIGVAHVVEVRSCRVEKGGVGRHAGGDVGQLELAGEGQKSERNGRKRNHRAK